MYAKPLTQPAQLTRSSNTAATLILPLILALGLFVRLYSVAFGLPGLNDPDELTFELAAVKLLSKHTLNPGWFGHPATTTIYVLAVLNAVVFLTGRAAGWFSSPQAFADAIYADPSWVILPGRIAMVLFSVGAIYLTWRLAREFLGTRGGLLAAALLAISPVFVTWSQIIRSDVMACFFMLLAMLAARRIAESGRWRDHVLAALWVGAAMATKWPYVLSALAVIGVTALRLLEGTDRRRTLLQFLVFGGLSFCFLFLISPYLLIDHVTAYRNVLGEAQPRHLGATGGTPWANALWYLSGPIASGLGLVGLALAAWGMGILARNREALAIICTVTLGFFVVLCLQHIVWERWVIALMPPLAIAAAAAMGQLLAQFELRLRSSRLGALGFLLLTLATFVPLALQARADTRARLNDTRQLASRWAHDHVPAGSTVLVEHFGFEMLPEPWELKFPFGDIGCVNVRDYLHGKVQLSTVEHGRGARSNVDYGTVAPAKRASCRTDFAILTQADRYAAERAVFPEEDAAYRELMARGTLVKTFAPQAGQIGGPTVRIVQFRR